MSKELGKAAISWTGGKDSSLALYEAKLLGYEIVSLATFAPSKPEFLAHPIGFMKYQAEALSLPHHVLETDEPFKESYEKAIQFLRKEHEITTLITGDIAEVDCQTNWIRECSKYSGVEVLTPLWGFNRQELINKLLSYKFKVIFSCVKKPWFTDDWLGIELNRNSLEKLRMLNTETGLDICGEQGEYHTLVLDGPPFKKSIHVGAYSKHVNASLMYINIQQVALKEKS
ncbi:MAG: diphthine--ammonia ligase [Deltaproteobacteria bacterium]|nr:diphthine--ammonia ligase [Deltaproteobacteria bacterium]